MIWRDCFPLGPATVSSSIVSGRVADAIENEAALVRARAVPGAIELSAEFGLPVEDCAAALATLVDPGFARELAAHARDHGYDLGGLAGIARLVEPRPTGGELRSLKLELAERARVETDKSLLVAAATSPNPLNRAERRAAERARRRADRRNGGGAP